MSSTPNLKPLLAMRTRALRDLLTRCDGTGLPDHPTHSRAILFMTALGLPQLRSVVESVTMRDLLDRLLEHSGPGGWFTGSEARDSVVSTTAAAAIALYEHRLADRTPHVRAREAWERAGHRLMTLVEDNAPGREIPAMERMLVFRAVAEFMGYSRPEPGPDRLFALAERLLPGREADASLDDRLWGAAGRLALFHQVGHPDVLADVSATLNRVATELAATTPSTAALALLAATASHIGSLGIASPAIGDLIRRFDDRARLCPMPPPDAAHTAMTDTLLACDALFRFAQAVSGQLQVPIWRWEGSAPTATRPGSPLRVHALTREPVTHACPALRVHGPMSALAERGHITYGVGTELSPRYVMLSGRAVDDADVLVLQRFFPTGLIGAATQTRIEKSRAAILYDLDDDLFALPESHPARETITPLLTDIRRMLHVADVVTTPSESLAGALRAQGARNVRVIPNAIHEPDWTSEDPAEVPVDADRPLALLLAGTASHESDYASIENVLHELLDRHGDRLTLTAWGACPESLRRRDQVRFDPSYDYNYRRYVTRLCDGAFDVALVPLRRNPHNEAKSAIKWLEYSAAGIPGVYADVAPYRAVVRDGEDGVLATPEDWDAAIERLIASPSERRRLASNAWRRVRAEFTLKHMFPRWRSAIEDAHRARDSRTTRVHVAGAPNPIPIPRHELLEIS